MPAPLTTLESARSYLDYHAPDEEKAGRHDHVNSAFQDLIGNIWDAIPDGPGKTTAVRAIGVARMQCNSAIANDGV